MQATPQPPMAAEGTIPELAFRVEGVESPEHAAVPTLRFALRIDATRVEAIRSILLDVQIQIAARRRSYDDASKDQLSELFGSPHRWGETLRTLPWVRQTLIVPPFAGSTVIEVPVTCTYDLEVAAASYLNALSDGSVPLEFLFSGSVFFAPEAGGLQTVRIPWTHEAEFDLEVSAWRAALDRHFPDSAWLRLSRSSFDRLRAYRGRHALGSWEATVDSLLAGREER
jgi:hypothetical protein